MNVTMAHYVFNPVFTPDGVYLNYTATYDDGRTETVYAETPVSMDTYERLRDGLAEFKQP